MYKCPNCGDDLRFDIASQKMKCESCESSFDPETVRENHSVAEIRMSKEEAEEYGVQGAEENLEVIVFQCPNCGAEIASTSLDAATFCSYCGAPAVFSKRVERVARPAKILPFRIDRKELKKRYMEFVKKTMYAPKELCEDAYLDNFVGYYMPYWDYDFQVADNVTLPAERSYRRGDYLYEDLYDLELTLKGEFKGITYDASSNLSDTITKEINPYDADAMLPFKASYMAGFYAELPDVPADTYLDDAEVDVIDSLQKRFQKEAGNRNVTLKEISYEDAMKRVGLRYEGDKLTMLPVWFLTWRKGDRVSYSVVNGATGKMSADIPVDLQKFFRVSAGLSLGIFILLNLFYTFIPSTTLIFSTVMATIIAWFFGKEVRSVEDRESPVKDQGLLSRKTKTDDVKKNAFTESRSFGKFFSKWKGLSSMISIFVWFVLFSHLMNLVFTLIEVMFRGVVGMLPFVFTAIIGILWSSAASYRRSLRKAEKNYHLEKREMHSYVGFPLLFAGTLIGALVLFLNPVADFWYYGAAVIVYAACLFAILDMVKYYNLLTTRAVPHYFSKKGADVHA